MRIHLAPQVLNLLLVILQFLSLRPSLITRSIPYSTCIFKPIMNNLGRLALVSIMVAPKL